MAAKFAFWRTPEGKPYRGNDGRHAPVGLLAEIGKTATVKDKQISWTNWEPDTVETAIESSLALVDRNGEPLCDSDTTSIVWQSVLDAIRKIGGGQPLLPHELLAVVNKRTAEFLQKPVSKFVLVTGLSMRRDLIKATKLNDCVIRPMRTRGRFRLPETTLLDEYSPLAKYAADTSYSLVRVDVQDRSFGGAIRRAESSLDCFRGIWTLMASYRSSSIQLGGVRVRPMGIIHASALLTLHYPNGDPVEEVVWYDPDLPPIHPLFPKTRLERRLPKIDSQRKWALRKLRHLPYRRELLFIMARYARALDHTNLDMASLQLWAILEKLTDTIGKNYETLIDRTLWDYEETATAKHYLEFLRLRRNQYVHSASILGDSQHAINLLKAFVDDHLVRLLRNDFHVTTLAEYGEFLSLPQSVDCLRQRRDRLQLALQLKRRASKSTSGPTKAN